MTSVEVPCGSAEVIEIVYGFPDEEHMKMVEDGDAILGGCLLSLYKPNRNYYCIDCDFKF